MADNSQKAVLTAARVAQASGTLIALGIVAAAVAVALSRPPFIAPAAAWMLIAALLVGLVPLGLFIAGRSYTPFPFMGLAGVFYSLFFALPPFLIDPSWWTHGRSIDGGSYGITIEGLTGRAAAVVLVGVVAMITAYYAIGGLIFGQRRQPLVSAERQPAAVHVVMGLIAVTHLVFLYTPLRGSSSIAQAMVPLGYLSLGLLSLAMFRGEMPRWASLGLALVIAAELGAHAMERLFTPTILLVIYIGTIYWLARRARLSVVIAGVSCLLVGVSVLKYTENPVKQAVRRAALTVTLQHVVNMTPARVSFAKGDTLANLLTNPVPRFLWPEKPREELGQWFGHRYRILNPEDRSTSMNLPWLIELYLNFGMASVSIGMALIGALMAMLERLLLTARRELFVIAGWALLFPLTYPASNISLMLGGLPTQAAFLLGFAALLRYVTTRNLVTPLRIGAMFVLAMAAAIVWTFVPKDRG